MFYYCGCLGKMRKAQFPKVDIVIHDGNPGLNYCLSNSLSWSVGLAVQDENVCVARSTKLGVCCARLRYWYIAQGVEWNFGRTVSLGLASAERNWEE